MKDMCLRFTEEEKRKISIMNLQKMLGGMMDMSRNRSLENVGLTSRQMDILMFLMFSKDKMISQVDIEKHFRMSNPTVTGIMNRLEAKNFIVRKPSEQDKRVKYIVPTDHAWEFNEVMNTQRRDLDRILFHDITEEELEHMLHILYKMCRNMTKHLGKADVEFPCFFQEDE